MSILGMTSYVMLFLVFECIVSGFFVVFTFPLTELKSEEESLGAAGSSDCTTGPRDRIKERKEGTKIGLDSWFWIVVFVVLHILQKEKLQKASQYCWQQLTREAVEDSERGKLMGWLMLLGSSVMSWLGTRRCLQSCLKLQQRDPKWFPLEVQELREVATKAGMSASCFHLPSCCNMSRPL